MEETRDTVFLKLFDDKGKCRHIEQIDTIRKLSDRLGTARWFLEKKKMHTTVFTAHKDTVIAYGMLESASMREALAKAGFGTKLRCRISNIDHVPVKKDCTLTLQLGGYYGDEPLLTFN